MDDTVLEFVELLRRNGLPVSTAESIDALTVTEALGLSDRSAFKAGVRAAVVKRSVDIPVFDSLFESFFAGTHEVIAEAGAAPVEALDLAPADLDTLLRRLRELLDDIHPPPSSLTRALLTLDEGRRERLLRRAGNRSGVGDIQRPFQLGQHAFASGRRRRNR